MLRTFRLRPPYLETPPRMLDQHPDSNSTRKTKPEKHHPINCPLGLQCCPFNNWSNRIRPNRIKFVLAISSHATILLGRFTIMPLFVFMAQLCMAPELILIARSTSERQHCFIKILIIKILIISPEIGTNKPWLILSINSVLLC